MHNAIPPVRTLLVDDEALARDLMRRLVARDPELELVGEAENGTQALARIAALQPDLVLLDVAMPPPDGLQVVARLLDARDALPCIVFVTAFDQHAVRAFELNALDYLVKPIDKSRFERAMERAKDTVRRRDVVTLTERLLALAASSPGRSPCATAPIVTVRKGDAILPIDVSEIIWVEADNQYVRIHTTGDVHVMPCSLVQFERRIRAGELVRVHRSALVNPERIVRVRRRANGLHVLDLEDGGTVDVARSRSDLVPHLLARLPRARS
jgi:two-component system LytT family response regulator